MATYDLTEAQLDANLTANFDATTRDAIIDYLTAHGAFTNGTVTVHGGDEFPATPPIASVELESITAEITPVSSSANLDAVIFDSPDDSQILVDGTGDLLIATAGGDNKIVLRGSGDYEVHTGDGSDTVTAGSGDAVVFGQGGDDFLIVGSGLSTMSGGTGNDTFWDDNAVGNVLEGDEDDDTFHVLGSGNDTVEGGTGNDTIFAGSSTGSNVLNGGADDDRIYGGVGTSTLDGGDGDNLLFSGSGAGGGSVLTVSGSGSNTLFAGAGSDTLDGSTATGGNIFVALAGAATMIGGSGSDLFEVTASEDFTDNNGNLTISAGGGTDTVFFDNFEIADAVITPGGGTTFTITFATEGLTVTVTDVETLNFTNGNVTL